jgi:hypothetical protein
MVDLLIQLNNAAIAWIQEGHIIRAFEILSYARDQAAQRYLHHDASHRTYRYAWVDCSNALAQKLDGLCGFNEGSMSLLYLKFLKIEQPFLKSGEPDICVCGFTWVLWYNLAILSALIGSPYCHPGKLLLKQALHLFKKVSNKVEPLASSKHWLVLQLSILTNEACVLSDLSMANESLERLCKIGITLTKDSSEALDPKDHELFLWTVKTMVEDKYAPAA